MNRSDFGLDAVCVQVWRNLMYTVYFQTHLKNTELSGCYLKPHKFEHFT